jgi:hypothetical protein
MNGEELATLQSTLPAGWKLRKRITLLKSRQGVESVSCELEAESDRFNVVLHGSWTWIIQQVTAYALSPNQGGS